MLLPIRAEIRTRRRPTANYILIALNILVFLITDFVGGQWGGELKSMLMLRASSPMAHEYLTYQFLHGDITHLIGNMLFLYIFGNAVCDRMGNLTYTLFYLGGGVFSAFVFAHTAENPMLGASGAIAAVTTAFLVLFPRVPITMLIVLYLITTFQVPSMLLIVFKIILWDNIIAPSFGDPMVANVAYSAHLGGYAYGFTVAIVLLLSRALPRNQFDMLALFDRWGRRQGVTPPRFAGRAASARPVRVEELASEPLGRIELTPTEKAREATLDALESGDYQAAARRYDEMLRLDAHASLPRNQQLEMANHLHQAGRHADAAVAYEAFLGAYPGASDAPQVRLLVGLICMRYLGDHERAAHYLEQAAASLRDASQRDLAAHELRAAKAHLLGRTDADVADA